jgi:SAM-dependent methyltransferase
MTIYTERQLPLIAARWDARAKTWDQNLLDSSCHLNEDSAYSRFISDAQGVILQNREFCRSQGIIDAGCGTGLVLAELLGAFEWGLGVDISPEMIRLATRKSLEHASFMVGDVFNLAALSRPAGAVVSRGVLLSHYGPEQGRAVLESAHATLVAGGFVIFDFLNEAARDLHNHVPEEKHFFNGPDACALARSAGFERVQVIGSEQRRVLVLVAHKQGLTFPTCPTGGVIR